jgi:8-oxo-dGTP diphosphatase
MKVREDRMGIFGELFGGGNIADDYVKIMSATPLHSTYVSSRTTSPVREKPKVRAITVGCGVIIPHQSDDTFLTLRRIGGKWPGQLSLPGGHPEDGESVHDCAVRETLEETGLIVVPRVVNGQSLILHTNEHIDKSVKPIIHHFSVYVVADVAGGTLCNREPGKHRDLRWMTIEEVAAVAAAEETRLVPLGAIRQWKDAIGL